MFLDASITRRVFTSVKLEDLQDFKLKFKNRLVDYCPGLKISRVRQIFSVGKPFEGISRDFQCLCVHCMNRDFDNCDLHQFVPPTRKIKFTPSKKIPIIEEAPEQPDDTMWDTILVGMDIAVVNFEENSGFSLVRAISDSKNGSFTANYFNYSEKTENTWLLNEKKSEKFATKDIIATLDSMEQIKCRGRGLKFKLDPKEHDEVVSIVNDGFNI